MKYIKHLQANKLTSITYSKQRRQALKDLKNLSIVGVGSLIGFKALQDSKTSF